MNSYRLTSGEGQEREREKKKRGRITKEREKCIHGNVKEIGRRSEVDMITFHCINIGNFTI